MTTSAWSARRHRSVPALVLVLLAALATACGSPATKADPAARVVVTPWSQTRTAPEPRALQGPSTAYVATAAAAPTTVPTAQLPVTVTDHQGTRVTVTSSTRVLALDLYGSLAQAVRGLGLASHLVGRDQSTDFPEAATLPLVTHGAHQLDAEAVLALHPTVLLTDSTIGPFSAVLQIRASGVPVVVLDPTRSLATVEPLITQVAKALGVPAAGDALAARTRAAVDAELLQIKRIAPTGDARLRVLFLYVRGHQGVYDIFGKGSGVDSLLDGLGVVDIASEAGIAGFSPLNAEALAKTKPDVILMMTGGLQSVGGVDGALQLPGVAQTPAGQHRRIIDMDDFQLLSFGPAAAQVLDGLARALYAPGSVTVA